MIPFGKYSGAGNTFLLFDNRNALFPTSAVHAACRKEQVDGVILLEAPCRMRILNRDGSEAEMCGNGLRCFARFLHDLGLPGSDFEVETGAGTLHVELLDNDVKIEMVSPSQIVPTLCKVGSREFTGYFLNTGVPHFVTIVDDLASIDVEDIGRRLRHHTSFTPAGTNVDFISRSGNLIELRTYERGVEGETLACGTGATASALVAAKLWHWPSPIAVRVRSQEILTVHFAVENSTFSKVSLQGGAHRLSTGVFAINPQ